VALIYVDVVEFEGTHIRRFYSDMASRFQACLEANRDQLGLDRLREGVPPLTAVMMASHSSFSTTASSWCLACRIISASTTTRR
jgi:hypothetical protein